MPQFVFLPHRWSYLPANPRFSSFSPFLSKASVYPPLSFGTTLLLSQCYCRETVTHSNDIQPVPRYESLASASQFPLAQNAYLMANCMMRAVEVLPGALLWICGERRPKF